MTRIATTRRKGEAATRRDQQVRVLRRLRVSVSPRLRVGRRIPPELQSDHAPVEPILARQQFSMGALFEDAAILEHNGPVGARDGAEPVGDDEGCAVAHEPLQRLLHRLFRLGVQR